MSVKSARDAIVRFVFGAARPSKARNARVLAARGERVESFVFREATAADIPALVDVHVTVWRDTYPLVLRPPTHEIRERQWRERFASEERGWFCVVVVEQRGRLVGFALAQPYSSPDLSAYRGELRTIFLLRDYQHLGLGRRLVGHVARRFLSEGIDSMVLFATAQNPSCAFYDALGGERLLAENGDFHGGYGWRDLRPLERM